MKIRGKTISFFFRRELGGLSFQLLLRQNEMWLEGEKKERKVGRRWKEGQFRAPFQARNGHFRENGGDFLFRRLGGPKEEEIGRSLWEPQGKGFPDVGISHFELCLPSPYTYAQFQIQCVRKRLIEKGKVRAPQMPFCERRTLVIPRMEGRGRGQGILLTISPAVPQRTAVPPRVVRWPFFAPPRRAFNECDN